MTQGNGNGGGAVAARDPETDRARLRSIHAALTAGDVAAAGTLAEDALRDGVDHVMVLSLVAGRREEEGRLADALALLGRARDAAPEAPGIANQYGLVQLRMERWDEAAASFGAALARDPDFAPALANRGMALMALARFVEAERDFAAAAARDPANLVAANGLAALALRRGETGEARRLADRVLEREPGFPAAVTTRAGADIAEGRAGEAEAALRPLLGDPRAGPADRALAWGLLGDALDAERRFGEAFAAWREANALQELHHKARHGGRPGTLALVRDLTEALAGRRVPAAFGHGGRSPARRHVFLTGFPCSGGRRAAALLAGHGQVAILADAECLIDATRDWMADRAKFEAFLDVDDEALEAGRARYWERVSAAGVDPAGRVFVDRQPFNIFKLPLIARLFPDALVLLARRDPRDTILAAFAERFAMSDPAFQMLTLDGAAELYAATMALVEASAQAFGLYLHELPYETLAAPDLAAALGLAPAEPTAAPPASGLARVGAWRDYEHELAPVLPILAPFTAPR